jgi:hypothetical protein
MNKSFYLNYILAVVIALSLLSCKSEKKDNIIGLNQRIHHDDFEYSVTSFLRTPSLVEFPEQITEPGSNYYLVRFKVENRALRVGHVWDNSIGYITDENGNKYENSKEDQILLDKALHFGWKEKYVTPAGTSDSTVLVFDIPPGVSKPYLMVRGGILMGDVFNGARFRKIRVKLF